MKKTILFAVFFSILAPGAVWATYNTGAWGLDRVNQRSQPLDGDFSAANDGSGAHVYIFGTGIMGAGGDPLDQHPQFLSAGFTPPYRVHNFIDLAGGHHNGEDCNGHSTATASLVGSLDYGVATGTTLHSVRVLNCAGSGSMSSVIAGMAALEQAILDTDPTTAPEPAIALFDFTAGPSQSINIMVQRLIDAGVVVVFPAGNEGGEACNWNPVPDALVVAGTYLTGSGVDYIAPYSNWGNCVDLLAPSGLNEGTYGATYYASTGPALNVVHPDPLHTPGARAGTSNAAALVAGGAAVYWTSDPTLTATALLGVLLSNATPNAVGVSVGTPNLYLFVP